DITVEGNTYDCTFQVAPPLALTEDNGSSTFYYEHGTGFTNKVWRGSPVFVATSWSAWTTTPAALQTREGDGRAQQRRRTALEHRRYWTPPQSWRSLCRHQSRHQHDPHPCRIRDAGLNSDRQTTPVPT